MIDCVSVSVDLMQRNFEPSRVYLEGRKRTECWDDKKTGSKNYRDLVYVDRIEFLDSRSNGNGESMPDESAEEHNTSFEDVPF